MHHVCRKLQLQSGPKRRRSRLRLGKLGPAHGAPLRRQGACVQHLARADRVRARARASGRFELAGGIRPRTITAISPGATTPSSPSACSSTWTCELSGLGRIANQSLSRHGRGLIHSIGRNYPAPLHPESSGAFSRARIAFDRRDDADFRTLDLSVLDVENLRLHYAKTLRHWLERYEAASERVKSMFDEKFVACGASTSQARSPHHHGHLQLFQVVFAPRDDNEILSPRSPVPGLSGKGSHALLRRPDRGRRPRGSSAAWELRRGGAMSWWSIRKPSRG